VSRSRLLGLTLFIACHGAALAGAQDRAPAAATPAQRIAVSAQPDGKFVVDAVNAPVTDVITAVATKAGLAVSSKGSLPSQSITVSFHSRWPEEILTELLKGAGINYVMTGGTGGRLFMATFGAKPDLANVRPEPVAAPAVVAPVEPQVPAATEAKADEPEPEPEPDDEKPKITPATGPTEWPAGIAPATSGAVRLPQTAEELFREVNGSTPVVLPSDVTPNVGPPKTRPEDFEPVNKPNAGGAAAGVAQPGAIAAPTLPPSANPNGNAPATPAPDMMQAPKVIQIPGPVVIEFPAPKKPR